MKKVEIDLKEIFKLRIGEETSNYIGSKLKNAGFDLNKKIKWIVDPIGLKYSYFQED